MATMTEWKLDNTDKAFAVFFVAAAVVMSFVASYRISELEDRVMGSSVEQEAGFWALVELFGHQQLAGYVTSQTIGGQSFVRVDVPETEKQKPWTKLYGPGAIYAITPMAEDLVRQKASAIEAAPLTAWDLPEEWRAKIKQQALPPPAPACEQDEWDDDEDVE
jgi:hypothetical protein